MLSKQSRAALPSARIPRFSSANNANHSKNAGSKLRELRCLASWNLDEVVEKLLVAENLAGAEESRRLDSPALSRFERGQLNLSAARIALLEKIIRDEIGRRHKALAKVVASWPQSVGV